MDSVERPSFWRFGNPIMWACLATMGFIALIVWFGLAPTCNGDLFPKGDCPPKWRHLYAAPPNEVGDTLAGLAGVLAFIWLIATVLLQSVELGEQRRVLALQKEEMEEQRAATQEIARANAEQVKISELQYEIYRDEREQRNQAYAQSQVQELCSHIHGALVELFTSPQKFSSKSRGTVEVRLMDHLSFNVASGSHLRELATKKLLAGLVQVVGSLSPDDFPEEDIEPSDRLVRLHKHIAELVSLVDKAGPVSKAKYEDEGLFAALMFLDLKFGRPI
jgi:hypothetical protein